MTPPARPARLTREVVTSDRDRYLQVTTSVGRDDLGAGAGGVGGREGWA